MSALDGPRFEPQTFGSRNQRVTARPTCGYLFINTKNHRSPTGRYFRVINKLIPLNTTGMSRNATKKPKSFPRARRKVPITILPQCTKMYTILRNVAGKLLRSPVLNRLVIFHPLLTRVFLLEEGLNGAVLCVKVVHILEIYENG